MLPPEAIYLTAFEPEHQKGVSALYRDIADEFGADVFSHSTDTITDQSELPGRHFWVTVVNGKVIGTVGLVVADNYSVLKSLFVHRSYRSTPDMVGQCLLQTAIAKAASAKCYDLYLGTMHRFAAARRFYDKNGFSRIPPESLPEGFPANSVDTVFYMKDLLEKK